MGARDDTGALRERRAGDAPWVAGIDARASGAQTRVSLPAAVPKAARRDAARTIRADTSRRAPMSTTTRFPVAAAAESAAA